MTYHQLAPGLDRRYNYSSGNLDLPIGAQADEKKRDDPQEPPPNWLSMRTGGEYTRFRGGDEDDNAAQEKLRRERVTKAMEDDRRVIEDARKTNAPIYMQVDVSTIHNLILLLIFSFFVALR
jgi:hypothetical protein